MKTRILIIIVLLAYGFEAFAQEQVMSLDECKRIALQNSTEIRNAKLDIVAAKAKKSEVITNFFPVISGNAWAFASSDYLIQMDVAALFGYSELGYNIQSLWEEAYAEFGGTKEIKMLNRGQHYGISAIQPVFLGGRLINGTRYATLGIEAARLKGEMTTRNKLEEVEANYFKVTALQEKAKTLESLQSLVDSLEKVAGIAYSEGLILKADYMLLQTKKLELQNGKMKLRTGLRLLKMNLLNSIGMEYKVLELDKYQFPASSIDDIPSPAMVYVDEEYVASTTQEHRLLDVQVQAKKYDRKLTLGSALPMVGVGATYGTSLLSVKKGWQTNGIVFVALRVPITDWAKTSFKLRQQQVAIEKAENDRDHLQEMLVLQQRKFFLELTSAWDELQLARNQREYSQYLYDQAKISYEAGYSTITDLLQVYANLSKVQENYCSAVSAYLEALQVYRGRIPYDNQI